MHHQQRNVWLTGVALLGLMVIFPPWYYFDTNTSNQRSAGYHFLFSRPPIKSYEEMFGFVPDDRMSTQLVSVRLNVIRLIVQLLTVAFLTSGLGLKRRGGFPLSGGMFMTLGSCGVVLLISLMWLKF